MTKRKQQPPPVYGCDVWRTDTGFEWSHWDLWFCLVCAADHSGDWSSLDTTITQNHSRMSEKSAELKWTHMLDLQKRLAAAGLSAEDLVGNLATDPKAIKKAHAEVIERSPGEGTMSPAMRNAPSRLQEDRAKFGWWGKFPKSPRGPYDSLAAEGPFDPPSRWGSMATYELVHPMEDAVEKLEKEAEGDVSRLLAVRRASLTHFYQSFPHYNDSYGNIGDTATSVLQRYSRTDWRSTGISIDVFWRDFFEMFCLLGNFGVAYDRMPTVLSDLGITEDLNLTGTILVDLQADYSTGRLNWQAKMMRTFRVYSVIAARAIEEFEAAAQGVEHLGALMDMEKAARKHGRPDVAKKVRQASDHTKLWR